MGNGKKMHGVIGGERRKRGEIELGCGRFFQHGTHHPSLKMAFAKKCSLHYDGESERETKKPQSISWKNQLHGTHLN